MHMPQTIDKTSAKQQTETTETMEYAVVRNDIMLRRISTHVALEHASRRSEAPNHMLVDRKHFVAQLFGPDRHRPLLEEHVAVDHLISTAFDEHIRALCRDLSNALLPPIQLLGRLVNRPWLQCAGYFDTTTKSDNRSCGESLSIHHC